MKIKGHSVFFMIFLEILSSTLSAQAPLDLNWELDDFTERTTPGRWVVLSGRVEGYRVLNREAENYLVELILINARWEGDDRILKWRGVVLFSGPTFQEVFPARLTRTVGPAVLTPGTKVLILARHTGWSAQQEAPAFEASQFRRLTS